MKERIINYSIKYTWLTFSCSNEKHGKNTPLFLICFNCRKNYINMKMRKHLRVSDDYRNLIVIHDFGIAQTNFAINL